MARKLKNPHKGELKAAARSVLSQSNAVLDQKFADLVEVRKEQKEYERMMAKERDAEARRSLEGAAKAAGQDADRLRREIDKHFARAVRDVEAIVKRVRGLPGAAAHKAHISKVQREVDAMKRPRKGFRDLRDKVRDLRASGVTLEGMIKTRPKSRRKVVRPKGKSPDPIAQMKAEMDKPGHLAEEAFGKSALLWAREHERETMSASLKLLERPSAGSYNHLKKVWKSTSKDLMKVPGMKKAKEVSDHFEGEESGAFMAEVISRSTGMDRATANRLEKVYAAKRFIDLQMGVTERRMERGEDKPTKTELRRIEKKLIVLFKLMEFEKRIVTPPMARRDIREVRAQIKEAKEGGILSLKSTQQTLLKKLESMQVKYADASKGWSGRDRRKIAEDLGGLRAMVVVARGESGLTPRRSRKAQRKVLPAKVTKVRKRKGNPAKPFKYTKADGFIDGVAYYDDKAVAKKRAAHWKKWGVFDRLGQLMRSGTVVNIGGGKNPDRGILTQHIDGYRVSIRKLKATVDPKAEVVYRSDFRDEIANTRTDYIIRWNMEYFSDIPDPAFIRTTKRILGGKTSDKGRTLPHSRRNPAKKRNPFSFGLGRDPGRDYDKEAFDSILGGLDDSDSAGVSKRKYLLGIWTGASGGGTKADFDRAFKKAWSEGYIRRSGRGEYALTPKGSNALIRLHRDQPQLNPKKKTKKKTKKKVTKKKVTKKKVTKKKVAKRKTAKKPEWQRSISLCQKRWEHYCKRPSKKRLEAVYVHMDKMKESTSKKVKAERSKCLRIANAEAKKLKYKRK